MRRRPVLLVALLVGLAGCGGDDRPAGRATATAATGAAPARAPGPDCGEGVRSHSIRFATRDGLRLSGAVVGPGPVGAVLIHEYPLDLCGWGACARDPPPPRRRALVFGPG